MMASWRDLIREPLRQSAAYHVAPLPAGAAKLDANESPYPLSAAAQATLREALAIADLNRYPDSGAAELRRVVAAQLGVDGDELLFGNGSDELIALLCAAFAAPRAPGATPSIAYAAPGFVVYRTAALGHGLDVVEVPFGPRFEADEAALFAALADSPPNIVFLATPNNPTGTVWPRRTVERLIAEHPEVITVVDEAYLAYHEAPSCIDLARAHPHCLVLQTLSKIGLAALRVGFLVGRREVLAEVEKVRPPYNLGTPAQRAAAALLLRHRDELDANCAAVRAERARLEAALASLPRLEVFPSGANFFLVRTAAATALYQALAARGVLVRNFDRGALHGCLRVTVGTPDENDRLIDALRAAL
jgi:histidinol-phosphate aminotransferase